MPAYKQMARLFWEKLVTPINVLHMISPNIQYIVIWCIDVVLSYLNIKS